MDVDGEVLNVLRWAVDGRDMRRRLPPDMLQPHSVFHGRKPAVVTKAEFEQSGFTAAHLGGVRFAGYRLPSSLVVETGHLVQAGESFVYAYYDGIDKVVARVRAGCALRRRARGGRRSDRAAARVCSRTRRHWSSCPTTVRSMSVSG